MAVRCPKCNRYGSSDLGGYCASCKASRRKPNYVRRDLMKKNYGFKCSDSFAPEKLGILRDEPKIIEKGK